MRKTAAGVTVTADAAISFYFYQLALVFSNVDSCRKFISLHCICFILSFSVYVSAFEAVVAKLAKRHNLAFVDRHLFHTIILISVRLVET